VQTVEEHAAAVGFTVTRIHSLQKHYARTLEMWAANLEADKERAIAIQSEQVYDKYMKYLTGCAKLFRQGYTGVDQLTLEK
jgi:cyclopropane-fatty-acyl-phospholipid synthase